MPHIFAPDLEGASYAFGQAQMQSHGDLVLRLYGQARGRTAAAPWGVVRRAAIALNAVPAFMPTAWSLLARFHLAHGLDIAPLAAAGAAGTATGRLLPELGSRWWGERPVPAANRAMGHRTRPGG